MCKKIVTAACYECGEERTMDIPIDSVLLKLYCGKCDEIKVVKSCRVATFEEIHRYKLGKNSMR